MGHLRVVNGMLDAGIITANEARAMMSPPLPPIPGGDPDISFAGSMTEPVKVHDPVAYLNAELRALRADRRHDRAQWFAYGASVGVVVFSVAVGVWG